MIVGVCENVSDMWGVSPSTPQGVKRQDYEVHVLCDLGQQAKRPRGAHWDPAPLMQCEPPKQMQIESSIPIGASIASCAARTRPRKFAGGRVVGTIVVPIMIAGTGVTTPVAWTQATATMVAFSGQPASHPTLVDTHGRLLQPTCHVAVGPQGELLQPYGPILHATDLSLDEAFGY